MGLSQRKIVRTIEQLHPVSNLKSDCETNNATMPHGSEILFKYLVISIPYHFPHFIWSILGIALPKLQPSAECVT